MSERAPIEHELLGPLAIIAGYAELLETREDEAIRLAAASVIRQSVSRLERAIAELLERR